jgi:hypothetical protein
LLQVGIIVSLNEPYFAIAESGHSVRNAAEENIRSEMNCKLRGHGTDKVFYHVEIRNGVSLLVYR